MAEFLLFEPDPHYQHEINAHLVHHGHELAASIATLPEAYVVMGDLIKSKRLTEEMSGLILTDDLGLTEVARRPDFTGPFVSTMPEDLAELQPADSPGILRGVIKRLRSPKEPEQPETMVTERQLFKSDAAMIAEINRIYGLKIPIIGMAAGPLRERGVALDPELDLTKANLGQLGPLATAVAQERKARLIAARRQHRHPHRRRAQR